MAKPASITLESSPPVTGLFVGRAQEIVSTLRPGGRIVAITKGEFSLIDVIRGLLDVIGPADVRLSAWTMALEDATAVAGLLDSGLIRSFRLYVDRSFPTRRPAYCAAVVARFGAAAISMSRIHAKMVTMRNDRWDVAIRGSLNLNRNRCSENVDIDDNAAICNMIDGYFDEVAQVTCGFGASGDEVEAVFGRIGRSGSGAVEQGATDLQGAAMASMIEAGVPIDDPRQFGRWVRVRLLDNKRKKKRPKSPAGLAAKIGVSAQTIVAMIGGRSERRPREEAAAALGVG